MVQDLFTINKKKVREMDFRLIRRHFGKMKGQLRYLGLPASNLIELISWNEYFCHYSAVERGKPGSEYIEQHNLMLTAMQHDLTNKLTLFRGDLDDILLNGQDEFANKLLFPYHVVSLDYSGGLIYKDSLHQSKRPESIESLFRDQSQQNQNFLLFISCNLDNEDQGEIQRVLQDINREFGRLGIDTNSIVFDYINHPQDEPRLKIFVPYLINRLSEKWYKIEHQKPIFYEGNRKTRMMHFSFWLKRTASYTAGKPNPSTIVDIFNQTAFCCRDGGLEETDFDIPGIVMD